MMHHICMGFINGKQMIDASCGCGNMNKGEEKSYHVPKGCIKENLLTLIHPPPMI